MSYATEASHSAASVSNAQDLTSDSTESKPLSVTSDVDCHGSIGTGQQQSTDVTSCLLQTAGDDIPPTTAAAAAAGDNDYDDGEHCSVDSSSLASQHKKTDSNQLAHHILSDAAHCISEQRHCGIVCEDDLSVFFASPVSVSSLSAKLKAVPKRKAKCEHEVTTSDSCELVADERELNAVNGSVECSQQCLLPLHGAVTISSDRPGVCEDVATSKQVITDSSAVYQSCSVQPSLLNSGTTTSECHLVHQPTDTVHRDASSGSLHMMLPAPVSFLPSSNIGPVVPSQDHSTNLMSSACANLPVSVSSSVTLLDKWSACNSSGIVSKSSGTQGKSRGAYSERSLIMPVKQNDANSRRFLYPSATHVHHSPVVDVFEHSSNDVSLLRQKRSSSFLYRAPDVVQSGCIMAQSKAEQHVKKTVSLAASGVVSCGAYTVAVASGRNTTGDGSSMPAECAVVEAEKKPSEDVICMHSVSASSHPLSAPAQSIVGVSCCSQWVRDDFGQTTARTSDRMTLCDVGVQTTPWELAPEDGSNVCKKPLVIDAAVQTLPLSPTNCTCHKPNQFHRNKRNSLWRCKSGQGRDLYDADATDVSCGGETETVSTSDRLLMADNTVCISTAAISGNRSAVTVNQAASLSTTLAGHDGRVPQCAISNESSVNGFSAEYVSLLDSGKLHTTKRETLSADKDLNCLTTVTDNHAQVKSDILLKNTNVSLPKSFSTGFVSAGGKPLSVKLSSKLNARKLLDDVGCSEDDNSIKNATGIAHCSNTDSFPVSSGYKRTKVIQDLISIATGSFDCITSGLVGTGSDNMSDCKFTDGSLNQTSKMSEFCRCDGDEQSSSSSLNLCSTGRVADIMFSTAEQFTDTESGTVRARAELNADYSGFNSAGMLHKSYSKDTISNGFKPFKAPRISAVLSKRVNNNKSAEAGGGRLAGTSEAQSESLESEDRVNISVAGTELLCDLTNTQRAEVVDASLVLLNSVEVFAMPSSGDDVSEELASDTLVPEAPGSSAECELTSNIITNTANDNVPDDRSLVPTITAADTDGACENVLTEQVQDCVDELDSEAANADINRSQSAIRASVVCSESEVSMTNGDADNLIGKSSPFVFFSAKGNKITVSEKTLHTVRQNWNSHSDFIQIHNTEQNLSSVADSVPSRPEPDVSDVGRCCGMPSISADAGFAEMKPAPVVSLQSSHYAETNVNQDACCKRCSCINTLCRCATENQNSSQSPERKNAGNLTSKSSSFAFFSAKGSKVSVSEKTLHTIRQNWNSHLNPSNGIGMESGLMTKFSGASEQLTKLHSSQMKTEEVRVDRVASDSYTGYTPSGSGNSSRNRKAGDGDENCMVSVPEVGVHAADMSSTSVLVPQVSGSDIKNVSNDAAMSVDSVVVISDTGYMSGHDTSVHVSLAKAAQHRLPLKFIDPCSCAHTGDVKHRTDRSLLTTLRTVPESKCDWLLLTLCC